MKNNTSVLICDCNSTEHQIVVYSDNEDNQIYCHIHLVHHGFFKRLWVGLKYIFGYGCKFGQWDEFILTPEHIDKLQELSNNLIKK